MREQAEELVYRMSNDATIDYENDWKVISIFIGGNDLCQWCLDEEARDPVKYVANIEEAIVVLQQVGRLNPLVCSHPTHDDCVVLDQMMSDMTSMLFLKLITCKTSVK